ncbi:BZIP transcription factor [Penicillium chermesinum]|uniref:Putative transcription factor kapC n=1 Tax=Penicillium chermesinum TaxID=63820 RepID=A0A9W9NGR2_9EURO|nr:BZIP transcription factor [Penicillium chermesinum]KAJ5219566.1 BZIP transcription factor [Penicillium chermesinum]
MQPVLAPGHHLTMQSSAQDHADQVLHDQLLAAQQHMQRPQGNAVPQHHLGANATSPRDQPNIDPAISGAASMLSAPPHTPTQPQQASPEAESAKSYGKRELSTSKRAAQNRAAQRAFRQRKETYIRKLEDENRSIQELRDNNAKLLNENYSLRDHIITLQSRLMDAQAEIPDLPPNIDLNHRHDINMGNMPPTATAQPTQHAASMNEDLNSLNRIAVAGLDGFQQNKRGRSDENQAAGGIAKQDGTVPHGLPIA